MFTSGRTNIKTEEAKNGTQTLRLSSLHETHSVFSKHLGNQIWRVTAFAERNRRQTELEFRLKRGTRRKPLNCNPQSLMIITNLPQCNRHTKAEINTIPTQASLLLHCHLLCFGHRKFLKLLWRKHIPLYFPFLPEVV